MMPSRSYVTKDDPCHDGKKSKDRVTVMIAAISDGSEKLPLLVFDQVDFEDFVNIDSRILTSEILSDTEIASNVQIFTGIENVAISNEDDDQGEPEVMVTNLVAEQHLEELKKYFFQRGMDEGIGYCEKMTEMVKDRRLQNSTQTTLTRFFSPI